MKNYLAIAIAISLCLLLPIRGSTEVFDFDILKQKEISRNEAKIQQYLIELTILQIEEYEKYLRQKKYGPRSYIHELNEVEKALDIVIHSCDYSIINTIEALVAAQEHCNEQIVNYEILLKEVKAKIIK